MLVVSLVPVPVASVRWRLGSGPWTLSVICKLSLQLEPGDAELCKQHDPIHEEDQFVDDAHVASPWAPSDLVPTRALVDVSLVGDAYSARGLPVTSLTPRLKLATVDKALQIDALGNGEAPASLRSAALGYDYASAGPGNPVGHKEGERPRAEYRIVGVVDPSATSPGHSSPGFGPIPSHWPSRQRLLRDHAEPKIAAFGAPCELPAGFDLKYFNAAPPDQQLPELEPNAEIVLENLHPEHAQLRARLPNIAPQVFVERNERRGREEHDTRITSVWIDTSRSVATVTWHASIELSSPDEPGRAWIAVAGPGRRLSGTQLSKLIARLRGTQDGTPIDEDEEAEDEPTADHDSDPLNQTVSLRARKLLAATEPGAAEATRERTQTSILGPSHMGTDHLAALIDPSERTSESIPLKHDDGMPAWMAQKAPSGSSASPQRGAGSTAAPTAAASAAAASASTSGAAPPSAEPNRSGAAPVPMPPAPLSSAALGPRPRATTHMGIGGAQAAAESPSAWPASKVVPPSAKDELSDTSGFPAAEPHPKPKARQRRAATPSEVTELLWFDEEVTPRVRRRWRKLAEELDFAPRDDAHDLVAKDPKSARDHHTHFGVLTGAQHEGRDGMRRALREAVSTGGRFTPPLVLLRGKLRFPFEELEILRATAATVTPVAGDDKKLTAALEQVDKLLETPLLVGSSDTVGNFTQHLRKLYKESRRSLSLDYLDEAVERVLLEQRRYHHRTLFGGNWIRAQLTLAGSDKPIPSYLPEALGKQLPMMVSFETRLIAEAHVRQDQYESHPHALKVVTLGRVVRLDG